MKKTEELRELIKYMESNDYRIKEQILVLLAFTAKMMAEVVDKLEGEKDKESEEE